MKRRHRGHRTDPEPFIGAPRFGVLRLRSSRRMIGVGMAEGLALFHISLRSLEPRCWRWLAIVTGLNYGAARVGIDTLAFCDGDLASAPDVGASRAVCFPCGSSTDGVRFALCEVTDSVQSN